MNNQNAITKQQHRGTDDTQNDDATAGNPNLPDHLPASVTTPSSAEEAPGLSDIFELLKNYRRRCVLVYLSTVDDTATLSDLAEQISGWENDKEPRLITSSERKRVYVGLYQSHLPKMDVMGAVSFNKPRGTIEKGPYFGCFHHYLPTQDESNQSVLRRCYDSAVGRIYKTVTR